MSSNIKVHFVTSANSKRNYALRACGVNYMLFSALDYIKSGNQGARDFSELNELGFRHLIVDSGLFTLMFGSGKGGSYDREFFRDWMRRIVSFAKSNNLRNASYVECDCQKLVGPEFAWELRREMRELAPEIDFINVFHIEDGTDGFRRLVDFSDYIAISVPEWRIARTRDFRGIVHKLAVLAKRQKPNVRIHLLGCTEVKMLAENSFCTTADSSSWSSPSRYGYLDGVRTGTSSKSGEEGKSSSLIKPEKLAEYQHAIEREAASHGVKLSGRALLDAARRYPEIKEFLKRYRLAAGGQD